MQKRDEAVTLNIHDIYIYIYIYMYIYIYGIICLPCTFIDVIYVILTVLDSLSFIPTCDSLQQTQRQVWSLTPCPRWTKPPRPRAKTQRLSLSSMPGMFFRRQSDLSLTFSYLFECSSREKEAVRCIESHWPGFASLALAEGKFFDVVWCLRPKKSDPMLKAGRGRKKESSGRLVLD